jgi:hypothetical protein
MNSFNTVAKKRLLPWPCDFSVISLKKDQLPKKGVFLCPCDFSVVYSKKDPPEIVFKPQLILF